MIHLWSPIIALPALGSGVVVTGTPTQLIAPFQLTKTRYSQKARVNGLNDDVSNSAIITIYESLDPNYPNAAPQTMNLGPKSMDKYEIPDTADLWIWIMGQAVSGSCALRVEVVTRELT